MLILAIALTCSGNALAAPYYQAGDPLFSDSNTAMQLGYYSGTSWSSTYATGDSLAIRFVGQNYITGPGGDILANGNYYQTISGTYTLQAAGTNLYNLTMVAGNGSITVSDGTNELFDGHCDSFANRFDAKYNCMGRSDRCQYHQHYQFTSFDRSAIGQHLWIYDFHL